MKKYWFKAKSYGYGWYPASWEGWGVTIAFILAMTLNAIRIDSASHSVSDTLINFVPETIIMVLVLLAIAWVTGEEPHWYWGNKPEDKDLHK